MATESITEAWLKRNAPITAGGTAPELESDARPRRVFDSTLPGYGVVIGARFATFVARGRVEEDGETVRRDVTIGRWGRLGAGDDHAQIWTEARARKRAQLLLGQISAGVDPVAKDTASSDAPTLRDALKAHLDRMRAKKRATRSIETLEHEITKYLADWLDRPIAELTGAALVEVHASIKKQAKPRAGSNPLNPKGAPLARRVIVEVSACWNSLNRRLEGALGNWNPTKSVDLDEIEDKHERIADDNLADYAARVATMKNPIQRDGLMLALFTGLRSEDVRTIRFENVNWDERTLHLPDPKGGEAAAFKIPLSATPLAILKRRQRDNARDLGADPKGWAFPAIANDGTAGPIGDLRQQIKGDGGDLKHGRFPAEDVHTLRRTWASRANDEGISELDQHVLSNHSFGSRSVNDAYISQGMRHLAKCAAKIDAGIRRWIEGRAPARSRGHRSRPNKP